MSTARNVRFPRIWTGRCLRMPPGLTSPSAGLPLAEGYETTFRNFDLQKQKMKLMQLKVAGQESVTVPAGTFDAFRVEVTSADGGAEKTTLWIAKEDRKPVKVSSVMPQMGGAVLTAELMRLTSPVLFRARIGLLT